MRIGVGVLLALAFAAIIAFLSYYVDNPLFYHRRVPSLLWGLFLGLPAALGLLQSIDERKEADASDDHEVR